MSSKSINDSISQSKGKGESISKEAIPLLKEQDTKDETRTDESTDFRRGLMQRMKSSVFFEDDVHGWLKGDLVETDEENGTATIIYKQPNAEDKEQRVKVKLKRNGQSQPLPLQCVDNEGTTVVVDDLRDLPYSNEASILYNLKERYELSKIPYTRVTNNVIVAINPYQWVDGLYSEKKRKDYVDRIVWKGSRTLPPHLYEISSMALKGILTDEVDQTIVVSGESGSGKTVSSKIIMAHLATFHEQRIECAPQEPINETKEIEIVNEEIIVDNEEKQPEKKKFGSAIKNAMKQRSWRSPKKNKNPQCNEEIVIKIDSTNNIDDCSEEDDSKDIVRTCSTDIGENGFERSTLKHNETKDALENIEEPNLIVQRVIDSNPLLEAFGNAKTCLNDNSSRFSRYSKLQFHVEDSVIHPMANIAGSTCHTFLLEKSRVVSHDASNDERTFHIFYQLMEAPSKEKEKIWEGLGDKSAASFKCIGVDGGKDEFTNRAAWKNTISALNTIGRFSGP